MLSKRINSGFTLIELMVVIALVGIISAFAVPSFSNVIANGRIASTSNDIVGLLNYARSEAVKRGRIVRVAPVTGTDWSSGAQVAVDGSATELRRTEALSASVTLAVTGDVSFSGGGFSSTEPTLTICDDRTGEVGRRITITLGGRIRAEDHTCT